MSTSSRFTCCIRVTARGHRLRAKHRDDLVSYLTEGGKYFSDFAQRESRGGRVTSRGAVLQFYMKPNQRTYTLENGEHALPTYGLSVDGRQIQSLASALAYGVGWPDFHFQVIRHCPNWGWVASIPTGQAPCKGFHLTSQWS